MAKPPALKVVRVSSTCSKLYCADCRNFLGLQHDDENTQPVLDVCSDGRKTCDAKETLNEFHDAVQKQIQEEEANRVMFDTLLADDPFADNSGEFL